MSLRASFVTVVVCATFLIPSQAQSTQNQSVASVTTSPVEVLYSVGMGAQSTLATYNINPSTLTATKVGSTITVAPPQKSVGVIAAPNDHFIYVFWCCTTSAERIVVYTTNSLGVPQTPPVQTLSVPIDSGLLVHPSNRFGYSQAFNSSGSYVRLFQIDPTTGKLSNPKTVATYGPGPYLYGLSSTGSKLYDVQFPGGAYRTYNYRKVDPLTGALGPEVAFFTTQDLTVTLSDKYIAQLNDANEDRSNLFLDVYANVVNPSNPLIHCTAAMLDVCHTATAIQFDPSNQYLFIHDGNLSSSQTIVARVDATNHQLVATGASIPGSTTVLFSPDGKLVYEQAGDLSSVQVYRFNRPSGTLTPGSTVTTQGLNAGGFIPATWH